MKTTLNLLFIFIFISFSEAQNRWSYETFFSLDDLSGDKYIGSPSQAGYFIEYPRYNYTFGINAKRSFSDGLTLFSGINYSKQEVSKSFNCPACNVIGDILPIQENQRYLQVPLGVAYQFLNGRFRPEAETGFLNNMLISSSTIETLGNESPKAFYLGAFIGARLHYQVLDQVGLNIGYRYTKSITDVFDSDFAFKSNNFIFGVSLSSNLITK